MMVTTRQSSPLLRTQIVRNILSIWRKHRDIKAYVNANNKDKRKLLKANNLCRRQTLGESSNIFKSILVIKLYFK